MRRSGKRKRDMGGIEGAGMIKGERVNQDGGTKEKEDGKRKG